MTQYLGVYTRRALISQYACENASGLLSTTMIDSQRRETRKTPMPDSHSEHVLGQPDVGYRAPAKSPYSAG